MVIIVGTPLFLPVALNTRFYGYKVSQNPTLTKSQLAVVVTHVAARSGSTTEVTSSVGLPAGDLSKVKCH